jgi:hypothetical protein
MGKRSRKVTVTKRTVTIFDLRIGYEYAKFTVDPQPNHYSLAIESSYGGYAFAWTHPGPCFYSFLAGLDMGYAAGKLVGGRDREFDPEATTKYIRNEILQTRRAGGCTAKQARQEWELVSSGIEHEGDFYDWMRDTELFTDTHEYVREKPGPRLADFQHLYELFWPSFSQALLKVKKEADAA